jgi:hypothetical protein
MSSVKFLISPLLDYYLFRIGEMVIFDVFGKRRAKNRNAA